MFAKKILAVFLLSLFTSSCSSGAKFLLPENKISAFAKNSDRGIKALVKKANAEYEKRNPELIKLKYKYMSESAFAFYRATAYIFYQDLLKEKRFSGVNIPLQGDLHLENLGTYQNGTKTISYDLNDFDEAFSGSYQWELIRCAVSIQLAAAENGFGREERNEFVNIFLSEYQKSLDYLQKNPGLLNSPIENRFLSKHAFKIVEEVKNTSYGDFLAEITKNGKLIRGEKIKSVSEQTARQITVAMESYLAKSKSGAKIKDIAFYVAGKGSLGRYRYLLLTEGPSTSTNDDLLLDVKEAAIPSISFSGRNVSGNQAERVVKATKYFIPQTESYLGTVSFANTDFFVRQLVPNEKVELEKLNKKSEFAAHLATVAIITARGHSRSGKGREIIADLGKSSQEIVSFSENYYGQVNQDFAEFGG